MSLVRFLLPPLKMAIILKSTKKNHGLLRYYHSVVKESMVSELQEGDHDIIASKSKLHTIAVEAIVAHQRARYSKFGHELIDSMGIFSKMVASETMIFKDSKFLIPNHVANFQSTADIWVKWLDYDFICWPILNPLLAYYPSALNSSIPPLDFESTHLLDGTSGNSWIEIMGDPNDPHHQPGGIETTGSHSFFSLPSSWQYDLLQTFSGLLLKNL
jgi:hypothetical protein